MKLPESFYQHSIVSALNPQGKRFMKAIKLPSSLNPWPGLFEIYAIVAFGEFAHIKCVPAFQMMLQDYLDGRFEGKHTIVVDSSGNTAHAVARLADAFGFKNVKVVMATDVPATKKNVFEAMSTVHLISVSNVAQTAREEGDRPGHYHLNQYAHSGNARSHEMYTGPEIHRLLGDTIGYVSIAMGSGGTASGVASYLKQACPGAKVIGAQPTLGDLVPGARDQKRMASVVPEDMMPSVHASVQVSRKASFIAMRQLWKAVEPQPGPSSGLAYRALIDFLNDMPVYSEFNFSRGKKMAFVCPDSCMAYLDVIKAELNMDQGV